MKKLLLLMAAVSVSLASCVYAAEGAQPSEQHLSEPVSTDIVGEHETAVSQNWKLGRKNREVQLTPIEFPVQEPKDVEITDFTPGASLLIDGTDYDLRKLYSRNKVLQTWLRGEEVHLMADIPVELYYATDGVSYVRYKKSTYIEQEISVLMPGIRHTFTCNRPDSKEEMVLSILRDIGLWASDDGSVVWSFKYEIAKSVIEDDLRQIQEWAHYGWNTPCYHRGPIEDVYHVIRLAALSGSVKVFKWFVHGYPKRWMNAKHLDKFALFGGSWEIIRLCEPTDIFTPAKCAQLLPKVAHIVEPQMLDYLVKRMVGAQPDADTQTLDSLIKSKGSDNPEVKTQLIDALNATARYGNAVNMIYLLSKLKNLLVGDIATLGDSEKCNAIKLQILNDWKNVINDAFTNTIGGNYLDLMRYLHDVYHADVNIKNRDDWCPLTFAASCNRFDMVVKYLVEKCHADVEVTHKGVMTPILYAVDNNNFNMVKSLCEPGRANVEVRNQLGRTPILCAAAKGNLDIVRCLYETRQANVDVMDQYGNTPMLYAAQGGDLDMVQYLYEACHANVEVRDQYGKTPMHYAARQKRLGMVQYLHETCHAIVETEDEKGETPIIEAIKFGNLDIVKYLYETCNAEIGWTDSRDGRTPLHLAVAWGKLNMVRYLLEVCEVDVTAKDNNGMMPLLLAVQRNYLEVANYLYENYYLNEGDLRSDTDEGRYLDIIKCLGETCQINVDVKDENGKTLLLSAAEKGYLEVVKYLYEIGHADVEAKDKKGRTPMICAAHEGYLDVVQYLYEACNANVESKDEEGNTPLYYAVKEDHLNVIQYLYEVCHANVDVKDKNGRTPLYNAAMDGHFDVAQYLVESCGVTISSRDIWFSAPWIALYLKPKFEEQKIKSQAEFDEALEKFLESGDPDDLNRTLQRIKDQEDQVSYNAANEALSKATEDGKLELVKYLVEICHANVNAKNKAGRIPMGIAAAQGNLEIVKYLYEICHADVEVKDDPWIRFNAVENDGCTPLLYAVKYGHFNVVQYLCEVCHANINSTNQKKRLPIIIALNNGDLNFVEYFVKECRANVNMTDTNGRTPLFYAIKKGNLDAVQHLVEVCCANVEYQDKNGETPLFYAIKKGNLNVVKYFVETCHASLDTKNKEGDTPLSLAVSCENLEIVKCLGSAYWGGDKINNERHQPEWKRRGTQNWHTCLSRAISIDNLNIFKYLAQISKLDLTVIEGEFTPLHLAAEKGHLEIVKYLCEVLHADVEICLSTTPIFVAVTRDHLNVVKYLYETCHANVTYTYRGRSLLYHAVNSSLNMVKYLVEQCHLRITAEDIKRADFFDRYGVQQYLKEKFKQQK